MMPRGVYVPSHIAVEQRSMLEIDTEAPLGLFAIFHDLVAKIIVIGFAVEGHGSPFLELVHYNVIHSCLNAQHKMQQQKKQDRFL